MGKLNHRLVAIVLLGVWCSFLSSANFNYQHRGVESYPSDAGKIVFFIIYVVLGEIGKKLDKNYRCPGYCEVDHKHIYRENQVIPEDSTKYFEKNLALYR
jgi:hypothetical protein